jgi:primosomal protein N' (replication factor Y)
VSGSLAQTLATWQHAAYASRELADRRELRFPPAVRLASVTGATEAVAAAVADVPQGSLVDALGPAPLPDGVVRTILRFDYAHAGAVAESLRAAVIRNATSRRRVPAGKGGYRAAPTLKVRFDDPEIL